MAFTVTMDASWGSASELYEEECKPSLRLKKFVPTHNMKPLPDDYHLGEHDVLCGRGKKCFDHIGNQRFRKMVSDMLVEYSDSHSKLQKTFIIYEIVNRVRNNSPLGGFVKMDHKSGRYFEVGDLLAREKTSQAFRDALHDQYRSSNGSKNKKKRRLQEQGAKAKQHLAPNLSSKSLTDKKKIALLSHEHTESMERSSFSGQKLQNAIRSIIDEAEPTNVAPAWFNNSSTNLEFTKLMGQAAPLMRQWHEEDEVSEKSIDALHRPNAFNDWHSPQRIRLAESANEIALNSDKLKNILDLMTSKRAPYARQPRSQVGNYTSAFEPSTTMGMTTGSINEKSIILSPIGDGSTRGLFKLLQGMGEGSERSIEGRFSPLPL